MVEFALFVVFTAVIVVFSADIAERSKSAWGNFHFKNIVFFILLTLFGVRYQFSIKIVVLHIIHYWKYVDILLASPLHSFEGAESFTLLMLLIAFTYVPVCLYWGIALLFTRKRPTYLLSITWFIWTFLVTILILA